MEPTLAGFLAFIQNVMGIQPLYLPSTAPVIAMAYNVAIAIANQSLAIVPVGATSSIYALAVYNLAGSNLINFAPDEPGQTYFCDLRNKWNISGYVGGTIQSASDEGTSESMVVPDAAAKFTLADLQYVKDPYGRQYLAFAQRYGTLWGMS